MVAVVRVRRLITRWARRPGERFAPSARYTDRRDPSAVSSVPRSQTHGSQGARRRRRRVSPLERRGARTHGTVRVDGPQTVGYGRTAIARVRATHR